MGVREGHDPKTRNPSKRKTHKHKHHSKKKQNHSHPHRKMGSIQESQCVSVQKKQKGIPERSREYHAPSLFQLALHAAASWVSYNSSIDTLSGVLPEYLEDALRWHLGDESEQIRLFSDVKRWGISLVGIPLGVNAKLKGNWSLSHPFQECAWCVYHETDCAALSPLSYEPYNRDGQRHGSARYAQINSPCSENYPMICPYINGRQDGTCIVPMLDFDFVHQTRTPGETVFISTGRGIDNFRVGRWVTYKLNGMTESVMGSPKSPIDPSDTFILNREGRTLFKIQHKSGCIPEEDGVFRIVVANYWVKNRFHIQLKNIDPDIYAKQLVYYHKQQYGYPFDTGWFIEKVKSEASFFKGENRLHGIQLTFDSEGVQTSEEYYVKGRKCHRDPSLPITNRHALTYAQPPHNYPKGARGIKDIDLLFRFDPRAFPDRHDVTMEPPRLFEVRDGKLVY